MRWLRLTVIALAALEVLAAPTGASGHLRSGTVAVDYRASVLVPETPAYAARIYQSDHGLGLALKPGHVVAMRGYLGEPVFRLDRSGLWVNAASPTAVVDGLVSKKQRVTASAPSWRLQRGRGSVTWHDARVQRLPRGVDHGVWSLPLTVDGRPGHLEGDLQRYAPPSLALWFGILACVLAAGAAPLLVRRRDLLPNAAIGFAIVAAACSVIVELALAFDAYASPGTWIEAVDSIAFLAVGLGVLLRGPGSLHVGAAIGIGLVALAVGLLNGAVFLHPIVLSVLPSTVMRLAVTTAIGAGLIAGVLGCLVYAETGVSSLGHELDLRLSRAVTGGESKR